ncbi:C40 family peptidase [Nocardiopsis dassonvillei]|nr:C40 family peptidase [Nocardiopsis dassonvillei]
MTMYVGDGQMVNAPGAGQNIRVETAEDPYYSARFMSVSARARSVPHPTLRMQTPTVSRGS